MSKNRVDEFIKNPKKALFTLALPMVIAFIVQTMYNVVDTAFVGRLGAESIAALTFSFPIFFVLIAINSGIATGMGSRISRSLGEKNKKEAENTAIHGFLISVFFALVVFIFGMLSLRQLLSLFGATGTVLNLAIGYMSIIYLGVFLMFPSFVLLSTFSAQGDTKTPMKVHVFVLLLNIVLDPIFIYVLGYGVKGAAIATVVAFSSASVLAVYLILKKSYLKIHPSSFHFSPKLVKEIFSVGAPASIIMLLISVYMGFVNKFMSYFGTDYVAAFGIISRLESVAIMPMVALALATLTLAGMFFGAKRYGLLKEISWYSIRIVVIFTALISMIFFATPSLFLRIFTPSSSLISIGSAYLRIEVFTFPLISIALMTSRIMQGMGLGIPGLVINFVRVVFVGIPLAYFFVTFLGYSYLSIAVAMVIGAAVSAVISFAWLEVEFRKLLV